MGTDKLIAYAPKGKRVEDPVARFNKPAKQQDCSVNSLVVKAIDEFIEREEAEATKG